MKIKVTNTNTNEEKIIEDVYNVEYQVDGFMVWTEYHANYWYNGWIYKYEVIE